ncbi:NlpC/P60 family protein [Streptomyces sp. NBC_01142]|uniref:C40 family peptidase n=1 Tax=Streptomyces sp. NBC_01142 TaxID=2975865 RepID=UPI00224DA641|nr:NlpC/P60 family protein [Streptomyces sp. NBC_01142]MCX4819355.1 NlpC/P60 family protein [Streptomyces sp. NBC_01142]
MSGRLLRSVCTAALVAATVVAAVPAHPATARPTADPTPDASPDTTAEPAAGTTAGTKTGTAAGSLAEAVSEAIAPAAGPAGKAALPAMLIRLQKLYRQAEEASEAYNATEEDLKKQQALTGRLSRDLARARNALVAGREDAGRLAREQYQGRSELSSYLHLLLAREPQHALDQDHLIERAASDRLATIARLEVVTKRAEELAATSRKALDKEQVLAEKQKNARDTATLRLKMIADMLASLSPEQIVELAALEKSGTAKAQAKLLATGLLGGERTPSKEGGRALTYAVEQIGKPYVWGAEGPESYDCSGLTSRAWARAGRGIPRTSQEQWRQLPKVPLRSLRPGDLVIYFPKATHVAIYLGEGMVVQAPRPGARVKVSPIAANPLLGAVRPDPGGTALSSYTPPELPAGATSGADTGYAAEAAPGAG